MVQASIAAVHTEAATAERTDWRQISELYRLLMSLTPSPIVELNLAVAVAMCDGPEAGITRIDGILEGGELANYYLAHSARAELCRRAGRIEEARISYLRALDRSQQEPERRFLMRRLEQLNT